MKLQPVTTTVYPVTKINHAKKSPNFEGGWNSAKLNLLARDERGMKELGKILWALPDSELRNASIIKNFCGIAQTKPSMDAYFKLKKAVEPYRNSAHIVKERIVELVEKENILKEKSAERVITSSKDYVMSNFIRPFVFQHVPSPNLLVSGSNYVASSDKFVYWAIKQAEQMNDNICYKSISTDKSQADLQNALNDAKEAQISYKDLTLFDISTKIKRVSTLQETNGLVELIKQAKEIPGVAVIAGIKDKESIPEAIRHAFDFEIDLAPDTVTLPEAEQSELENLKAVQQGYINYLKRNIGEFHTESGNIVANATKEIESWGKPKINPRYKNIMNINNIY